MVKTCHGCHGYSYGYEEIKLRRCAGCQKVYYCSTDCQKEDWVEHIFDCKPRRPINTSDYLALAVRKNLIPEHPQTCDDYGFSRAFTAEDRSMLLGLYIGLITYRGIPAKTIHDWRVRGVLVEEIKVVYYKIPESHRGGYFPWFLQNEHLVLQAGQPLSDETLHDRGDAMIVRAWRFTGGSDRDSAKDIRAAIGCKSIEDQKCHNLYALLLSRWHPSPDLDLWIDFGFASCTSQDDEMGLGAAYQRLITKCTFKEFCDSYRTRRLLDLFHSKGLQVKGTTCLRDLIQDTGDFPGRKSVWYLKQSIMQEDSTKEQSQIRRSVMVDYGFINCRNDSEVRELKRVYSAFFDKHNGDPLALHEAAIKGNIHGYLSTVVQGLRDPKFQRLMKNLYPL